MPVKRVGRLLSESGRRFFLPVSDRGALHRLRRLCGVELPVALCDAASPLVPGNDDADMVLGLLVSLIALAGLLVTVVLATRRIDQRPRTDDAYLQADLVHMAPDVSGRIVELDVRDNQAVRKGDVLFRIDPDPYRMRVDQARAAVRGLQAKLALIADQVAAQTSKAGAAAIAKLSALIPTMVYELAKADLTPILEAQPQVAQELCRALARRQAAGRLSASPELDESVPKHRLTSWFPDRIHRLYDLANAE